MKTSLYFSIPLLVLTIFVASCSKNTAPTHKSIHKPSVVLKYHNGDETRLDDFYRSVASHSTRSRINTGVPTRVEWEEDYIALRMVSPDYPYTIYIPFETIDEITFSEIPKNEWSLNIFFQANVKLGDGTVLHGGTYGYFIGQNSLGKVSFNLEEAYNRGEGLHTIDFVPEATTAYNAEKWGQKNLLFHKIDGTSFRIEDAAFAKPILNENGCWLGDEPSDLFDFESKGSMMEIPWAKIREIIPGETSDDYKERLRIVGMDGASLKGYCPAYVYTAGEIRGLAQVTDNYTLLVDVELCHYSKAPFTKIELNPDLQ